MNILHRLGIGATPSAKTEVSTSLGRETARLHGRLAGKKRGRDTQDTEEQPKSLTNGLKKLKVDQDSSSEEDSRAATISRTTKSGDKFSSAAKTNVTVDKFAIPKQKKSKKHKRDDAALASEQANSEPNQTIKDASKHEDPPPNGLGAGHSDDKAFRTPKLPNKTKAVPTLFNASFSVDSDIGPPTTNGEASLKSDHAASASAASPHSPLLARHSPPTSHPPTTKRESSTDAHLRNASSSRLRSNSILSMSSSSSRRSSLSRQLLKRELLRDPRFLPRVVSSNNEPPLPSTEGERIGKVAKEKGSEATSKPVLQLEPLPKPSAETASGDANADGGKKKRRRKKKKRKHADDPTHMLVAVDEEDD